MVYISRTKWLNDDNHNTKYYHLKTLHHRRNNKIVMIKINKGYWIEEEDQVSKLFIEHYKKLFSFHGIRHMWD